jgi:hypothetical protein
MPRQATRNRKKNSEKDSNKVQRRASKHSVLQAEPNLQELLTSLRQRKHRIVKAISESTEQFQTGRYEGPEE